MKIGAVVRLGPLAPGAPPARYAMLRDLAQQIESVGLDSVWLYDHLLYRWPAKPTDGIWECWTVLSALAEATTRVELGTLVACTAFRNPAVLAKMAVTLDEVSDGRLILGLGAGWHQPEFDAFGIPFDHRASRFEEAVNIIRPLLREGRADVHGTYYSAPNCEILPNGPRPAGPPLLLAGSGPRMLDIIARQADQWNTAWHAQPESVRPRIELLHQACERNQRDPATLDITVCVAVAYPDLNAQPNFATNLTEHIEHALEGYAALGVAHVIVELAPFTPFAIDRFAASVQRFRNT